MLSEHINYGKWEKFENVKLIMGMVCLMCKSTNNMPDNPQIISVIQMLSKQFSAVHIDQTMNMYCIEKHNAETRFTYCNILQVTKTQENSDYFCQHK